MTSLSGSEIWLRANRRALVVGSVAPVVLGTVGVMGASNLLPIELSVSMRLAAGILAILSALVGIAMANQARLPRLAYADGKLLIYAGSSKPYQVPIDIVEVFFGGQGATDVHVPSHKVESRYVVVRLAERHKEWHERKMRPSFGRWDDGYISLSGVWCEPITADLIKTMNHKLVETKRALRMRRNDTVDPADPVGCDNGGGLDSASGRAPEDSDE